MNPFLQLISSVFSLLNLALFIWIILRLLISFDIVNRFNPIVSKVNMALTRLFDPLLRPIRNILPDLGGIDLSPIVLILLLQFLQSAIYYYF